MYNEENYVVVDLETTGLSFENGDEIIEIGVTEIKNDNIKLNYSRLIKPVGFITTRITQITNITNEMVKNEKSIEEVLPKFREYIGDKTVIAHNAKFDIGFLNHYLGKMGLKPIEKYICTLEMLKNNPKYTNRKRNLAAACEFYGIDNKNAHRADSDTLATAQLFLLVNKEM